MKLSDRLAARDYGENGSNSLDVLIEVALFVPHHEWVHARANAAGTKVVYIHSDGHEDVCWANDWTAKPDETVKLLRVRGL